jgi:hypothetical protein
MIALRLGVKDRRAESIPSSTCCLCGGWQMMHETVQTVKNKKKKKCCYRGGPYRTSDITSSASTTAKTLTLLTFRLVSFSNSNTTLLQGLGTRQSCDSYLFTPAFLILLSFPSIHPHHLPIPRQHLPQPPHHVYLHARPLNRSQRPLLQIPRWLRRPRTRNPRSARRQSNPLNRRYMLVLVLPQKETTNTSPIFQCSVIPKTTANANTNANANANANYYLQPTAQGKPPSSASSPANGSRPHTPSQSAASTPSKTPSKA